MSKSCPCVQATAASWHFGSSCWSARVVHATAAAVRASVTCRSIYSLRSCCHAELDRHRKKNSRLQKTVGWKYNCPSSLDKFVEPGRRLLRQHGRLTARSNDPEGNRGCFADRRRVRVGAGSKSECTEGEQG